MTDQRSAPPDGADARTPPYADRGDGWTLAMELLTATFVWGGVGWLVDRWLGTAPVLMTAGFVLGNALGIYLIWVRSQDRFTREHADLMARRQRAATLAPSGPPPPDVVVVPVDRAEPDGAVAGPDPNPDVLFDEPVVPVDEPVAPLYGGERND